jgi:hypothetical protein
MILALHGIFFKVQCSFIHHKILISQGLLNASLAQLVERFIRNEQVVGSSPMRGSIQNPK